MQIFVLEFQPLAITNALLLLQVNLNFHIKIWIRWCTWFIFLCTEYSKVDHLFIIVWLCFMKTSPRYASSLLCVPKTSTIKTWLFMSGYNIITLHMTYALTLKALDILYVQDSMWADWDGARDLCEDKEVWHEAWLKNKK